jgi:RNAse (barnase) inhibitor barstar
MIMSERLFTLGKPCFYLIEVEKSPFQDLALQLTKLHQESIIRIIRGEKSKSLDDFFNEIAASLQFPYYFGENWAAFEECITDLEWLEGDAYLLLINDAHVLLQDSEEDFRLLLRSLERANEQWLTPNTYIPRQRPPTPFHVLFQCTAGNSVSFSQRVTSAHIQLEQLKI